MPFFFVPNSEIRSERVGVVFFFFFEGIQEQRGNAVLTGCSGEFEDAGEVSGRSALPVAPRFVPIYHSVHQLRIVHADTVALPD